MRIRVEIIGGPAKEGIYVYDTGEIAGLPARQVVRGISDYVMRVLLELGALGVHDGGVRG